MFKTMPFACWTQNFHCPFEIAQLKLLQHFNYSVWLTLFLLSRIRFTVLYISLTRKWVAYHFPIFVPINFLSFSCHCTYMFLIIFVSFSYHFPFIFLSFPDHVSYLSSFHFRFIFLTFPPSFSFHFSHHFPIVFQSFFQPSTSTSVVTS